MPKVIVDLSDEEDHILILYKDINFIRNKGDALRNLVITSAKEIVGKWMR